MRDKPRRTTVVGGFGAVLAVVPFLVGRVSGSGSAAASKAHPAVSKLAHGSLFEPGDQGDAESEAYADRAYPDQDVTIGEIQGARAANDNGARKRARLSSKWDSIGPDTLDVDRLGTQSFIKPTEWSGRVTALTVDPKC